MRHLNADKPLIVGHSLGGAQATFYAARYPVTGVINIDQPLRFAVLANALHNAEAALRRREFANIWAQLRSTFGLEFLPDKARELEADLSRPNQAVVLGYWDILLRSEPEKFQRYMDEVMEKLRIPYLAYHGIDPGADYENWLTEKIPSARLIYRPSSGHFPHLVHPDEMTALIQNMAR